MTSRRRTRNRWSTMKRRGLAPLVALGVIAGAVIGGVVGTDRVPELVEARSIPGLSSRGADVVAVPDHGSLRPLRLQPGQLWQWHGASAGPVRTVVLTIAPRIYPADGVRWYINGAFDRDDIYGPLDEPLGLWHSSTRELRRGDVVSACWADVDGIEHCPAIVVS